MKWVPSMAPVGKRRPGGKELPVIDWERSLTIKSDPEMGERTSSSRCTFVNCSAVEVVSSCFVTTAEGWKTYVVVAEKVDIAWVFIGGSSRVGEVNQSVLSTEFLCCTWISGKSCPGGTEVGYV